MRSMIAVLALIFAAFAALPAVAAEPRELRWEDLVPAGESGGVSDLVMGIIGHGELPMSEEAPESWGVVHDFNGESVRLPGYLVPLDLSADGGTEFLLVPYFGACIHVPPPPPNQIVYVTTDDAYMLEALFEPVYVTGTFDVFMLSTDLAETAYSLAADRIDAFFED